MNRKSCVYVIPFKVNNWQLPIRVQVSYARDYSKRKNLIFSLPKSELLFSKTYNTLNLLLKNGFSEFIIFSEILIANKECLKILKIWRDFFKKDNSACPLFHFTYSDESMDINKLILTIEKVIRNKKYAMSYKNLKTLRNKNMKK